MLFEMLAGFRPYRRYEHNASLLDNAIRRQEAREGLPPATDPALAGIVQKLLAPQIERRYSTADAIADDLDAFLRGAPTVAGLEHAQASQETVRLARGRAAAAAERAHGTAAPGGGRTGRACARGADDAASASAGPAIAAHAGGTRFRPRIRRRHHGIRRDGAHPGRAAARPGSRIRHL
jgi:hypothetical protein